MKKTILTIIQILVAVGLLYWLLRDHDKRVQMAEALKGCDKIWVLASLVAFGVVELLATLRWMVLLKVQGVSLSFLRVMALFMIGILFNPFMPGGTGGDVIKIFFLIKETPDKKAGALLAVLMDRLIGLLGLIACTGLIFSFRYRWLSSTEVTRNLTWTLLLIMGSSFAGIVFSFLITGFGLAHKLPAKMPMRDKLIDLSVAYSAYGRAWKSCLGAFILSIGVHLASFSVFFAAAKAMRQSASLLDIFGVMPIINTISALPITVGGAGVREKLCQDLLSNLCGISPAVALAISLTSYMVTVFWAGIGGVVYLLYRPSEHARMSEMEATVHNLEHKIAVEE